ncbi:hypothetical protein ACH4SP_29320 [Streptomyces sp. NPDC021093]|uniref:hypothetical protein n=1 Tax=Streptomyces sp. NPDC021093 TaxID=3365112 RepID=UPI0037A377A9
MRATRPASTAVATAIGFAALTCVIAPASAADGDTTTGAGTAYRYSVTPSTIAPGGQVTLTATGCPGSATVTSGVFDPVLVPAGRSGRATVGWDAEPGAVYDVAFSCNDAKGSTSLTVAGSSTLPTTSSTSRPSPVTSASPVTSVSPVVSASPLTSASPVRGVRGGLGGSIGGMDSTQVAGGAALVVLAIGGGWYAVHRRAAGNRRH